MSRIPPSLEYFVIYNKSLQASGNVSGDDDDAQEEAHILFYTCRPGGVKRDKMLRQIGLAKALISFSEAFTNGNGEACEMVHSARTKLVMVSPEKEYWIHACVNVAYTERKNKDGTVKKEYQEASVHDVVLKTAVHRAYQEFKLLHGAFGTLLSKGRSQLERHLEKFFTVWAWKWDIESPAEFISHLGTPLSAYCKYLSPLVGEVQAMLPDDTPVVLLSTTNILASSPSPSSALWTTLPSHLIRLIPPPEPPQSENKTTVDSTIRALTKSNATESMLVNQTNMDGLLGNHGASGGHSTVNFLAGMPNMKKWTGFLTFSGKSRPPTPRSAQDAVTPPQASATPPASKVVVEADVEATSNASPTPIRPEVDQQSLEEALQATAIQSTGHNGASSNGDVHDAAVPSSQGSYLTPALEYLTSAAGGFFGAQSASKAKTPEKVPSVDEASQETQGGDKEESHEVEASESMVNITDVSNGENNSGDLKIQASHEGADERTIAEQALQNVLSHTASAEPSPAEPPILAFPSEGSTSEAAPKTMEKDDSVASRVSSRRTSASSAKPAVILPPPEAFFVPLSTYLEDGDASELRLRRLYHMSLGGMMLALVMQPPDTLQSPTDTGTLSSRRFASFGGVEVLDGLGYPAYTDLPRGLEYKTVEILRNARRILDKWEMERGKEGSSTNAASSLTATGTTNPGANGMRRFVVSGGEDGGSVLASLGFSSTSGWLFEGQSTLRRDKTILEQFSRTTTSQSWYISKRIPSLKPGGHEREVHMEVAKKDSNLVDVDNDLATIVRRLDSTSY